MSRRRSAPAARGSSAQRAVAGGRQVMVPTARSDVYGSLLGVALGTILIGCILLALVMRRYDFKVTAPKLAALTVPTATGATLAPAPVELGAT